MTIMSLTPPAGGRLGRIGFRSLRRTAAAALLAGTAFALGGCAGAPSNSVIVGSVPQDYRTTHPIVISEQEQTLDVPVASSDRRMVAGVRDMVRGFAQKYRHSASGMVRIMVPHGSANAGSASIVSHQVRKTLIASGVPASLTEIVPYDAGGSGDAPIRVAFRATTAHTNQCGRWPTDLAQNDNNGNYENFGCASQNNLAAQVANPSDLLGPRGMTPIDSERRTAVYQSYVTNGSSAGK